MFDSGPLRGNTSIRLEVFGLDVAAGTRLSSYVQSDSVLSVLVCVAEQGVWWEGRSTPSCSYGCTRVQVPDWQGWSSPNRRDRAVLVWYKEALTRRVAVKTQAEGVVVTS